MKLSTLETFIIKELFKSSKHKLYAFNIYKKSNEPISKFNKAMDSLILKEFAEVDNDLILKLTKNGTNWLLSDNNKKVSIDKSWLEIPKNFKSKYTIESNSFYVPNTTLLGN